MEMLQLVLGKRCFGKNEISKFRISVSRQDFGNKVPVVNRDVMYKFIHAAIGGRLAVVMDD